MKLFQSVESITFFSSTLKVVALLHLLMPLASASTSVPVLHRVGIIPSQWNGSEYGLENLSDNRTLLASELIEDSKRFMILNQDLVEDLWHTPQGRLELKSDFEIDAYISFNFLIKSDHVVIAARILDSDLKILLQESETIAKEDLISKSLGDLKNTFKPLVFRLLNRLPIDVSVTSVQGPFITISGGENQAISVGDELDIVRAKIKSIHPAHGGWNEFNTTQLGKATVIETKANVSVAKVTTQTKEGAIAIGDGAIIKNLGTRRLFSFKKENLAITDRDTRKIIIPPAFIGEQKKVNFPKETINKKDGTKVVSTEDGSPSTENKKPPQIKEGELTESDAELAEVEINEPAQPLTQAPVASPTSGSPYESSYDSSSVLFGPLGMRNVAESVDVDFSYKSWTFNGPTEITSQFSLLPINHVSAVMNHSLSPHMKYGFGGSLAYGGTSNDSSFIGYGATAEGYWTDRLPMRLPILKMYEGGALASFEGMSISEGRYGGRDVLSIGFFAGLSGDESLLGNRYGFRTRFALIPMAFGRIGYDGSQKSIRSTNGWKLSVDGFTKRGKGSVNWGAGFAYGAQLFANDASEETEDTYMLLSAKGTWRF